MNESIFENSKWEKEFHPNHILNDLYCLLAYKSYLKKEELPLDEFSHQICLDILKEKKEKGLLPNNFFDELEEIQKLRQEDKDFKKFLGKASKKNYKFL